MFNKKEKDQALDFIMKSNYELTQKLQLKDKEYDALVELHKWTMDENARITQEEKITKERYQLLAWHNNKLMAEREDVTKVIKSLEDEKVALANERDYYRNLYYTAKDEIEIKNKTLEEAQSLLESKKETKVNQREIKVEEKAIITPPPSPKTDSEIDEEDDEETNSVSKEEQAKKMLESLNEDENETKEQKVNKKNRNSKPKSGNKARKKRKSFSDFCSGEDDADVID